MPDPIQPDDVDVQGQPRLIRTFYGPTIGWKNVSGVELDLGTSGGVGDGGPAGGVEPQIQYNLGGNLQGDARFLWDYTTGTVLVGGYGEPSAIMLKTSNPTPDGNENYRRAIHVGVKYDNTNSAPTFGNNEGISVDFHGMQGQCTNGPNMSAKRTFLPHNSYAKYNACGQKFISASRIDAYGMGDTATWGNNAVTYAGGPVNGDEGQGWQLVANLSQQNFLATGTITSKPTQSTYSGLLTQQVFGDFNPQTVSVNSTAGLTVGDWIVVGQETANPSPLLDAVQVTAFGPGNTITGIFFYNHPNGSLIKPALVLFCTNTQYFGQDRVLVNMGGAVHSAGTITGVANNQLLGTTTGWSVGMVGGDVNNVGAISLAADDYTASPFGPGASRLRSWFQIISVQNATTLTIHSLTVAGVPSYLGKGPGSGAYEIRPCARILKIVHSFGGNATGQIICEYSPAAWNVGNAVECVICPYVDVSGFQYHLSSFTAGGTYRAFMRVVNLGGRAMQTGLEFVSEGAVGTETGAGGADTRGWGTGINMRGVGLGLNLQGCRDGGILLDYAGIDPLLHTDRGGDITWGNTAGLRPNSNIGSLDFNGALGASSSGTIHFYDPIFLSPGFPNSKVVMSVGADLDLRVREGTSGTRPEFRIYQWNETAPELMVPVNYERMCMRWGNTGGGNFVFGTEQGGTGMFREMEFMTGGTSRWRLGGVNGGDVIPVLDNTYDIGDQAGGGKRPRDVNVARNVVAGAVGANTHINTAPKTVGTLSAPNVVGAGSRSYVTDATQTASGNFGVALAAGGGANHTPVYSDGSVWRIG